MKKLLLLATISLNVFAFDNVKALKMALDDEYKAFATYQQVIKDFGEIRPFINIINSEQRHINTLKPFFKKYKVEAPSNNYLGNIERYESVQQACEAGVQAEIDNVALYDRIYALTDDQNLIDVFKNLQWASQERHLRAFKRCANR